MNFGLSLRNTGPGASAEAIETGAETAERLGWKAIWTTDHVLVPESAAGEYGRTFEAIETLAWAGARHPRLKLGTSVIVVPQRNAVVLAKELATLDLLSGGRLIAGVGVGWNETEFANLGAADRFHRRGAYLDETIRLWRHLWSGSTEPFHGVFHEFSDFVFGPLPIQGDRIPIIVGGSSPAALRRAGSLADGYHATRATPDEMARRIPVVRAAAEAAGRPAPALSVRVPVSSDLAAMLQDVRAFEELGVEHLALVFPETDPANLAAAIERFDGEVVKALGS
ncbi:MAG: TIGR03619 family F420-dependent LLM class oxidoreductase [Candidatus Limnocylindrales bacterium]|jgi:probable F420-dependent oxidoreductase